MSELYNAMTISSFGMKAQGERVRVISQNMANANTLPNNPDDDPYIRKTISFENVMDEQSGAEVLRVADIKQETDEPFKLKYMPHHPGANDEGFVKTPNINSLIETMDMREAQRSYEANLGMIRQARSMIMSTIELLR